MVRHIFVQAYFITYSVYVLIYNLQAFSSFHCNTLSFKKNYCTNLSQPPTSKRGFQLQKQSLLAQFVDLLMEIANHRRSLQCTARPHKSYIPNHTSCSIRIQQPRFIIFFCLENTLRLPCNLLVLWEPWLVGKNK